MPYKNELERKEYHKNYHKKWYSENKKREVARQGKRSRNIRDWFAEYKSTLKCNRCPENHPACLEFHHINEKNNLVSSLVAQAASKKRILEEVALCEVVCANCHRKEHWLDRGKHKKAKING